MNQNFNEKYISLENAPVVDPVAHLLSQAKLKNVLSLVVFNNTINFYPWTMWLILFWCTAFYVFINSDDNLLRYLWWHVCYFVDTSRR